MPTANDVAASGQKLSEDAIAYWVSGEDMEYAPAPGTGAPPVKKTKIFTEPTGGANSVQIRHVVFEF